MRLPWWQHSWEKAVPLVLAGHIAIILCCHVYSFLFKFAVVVIGCGILQCLIMYAHNHKYKYTEYVSDFHWYLFDGGCY